MEISEKKLYWQNPVDWYQYKINLPDNRQGDAMLIYQNAKFRVWTEIIKVFTQLGLEPNDKVVHLNEFYPNWRWLNESIWKYMRTGLWTKILKYLIKISKHRKAKAMFVFTWNSSMRNFLLKHWFTKVDDDHYIKML